MDSSQYKRRGGGGERSRLDVEEVRKRGGGGVAEENGEAGNNSPAKVYRMRIL